MKLIEVVRGLQITDETVEATKKLAKILGNYRLCAKTVLLLW